METSREDVGIAIRSAFLRKADRIAIEKSSRLVTMTYH